MCLSKRVKQGIALLVPLLLLAACNDAEESASAAGPPNTETDVVDEVPSLELQGAGAKAPERDPLKQAWFGDLHIHSSWSLDAFAFQVRVGPEDAYRYARGEAIDHISGKQIQMQAPPLDFIALTEHANYMGIPYAAQQPGHPVRDIPVIADLLSDDPERKGRGMAAIFEKIGQDIFMPELDPDPVIEDGWRALVDIADKNNVPGEFTAFVGYEYTAMPGGQNLHRNVIFRGSDVPARPFSSFDSQNPEDLWQWMDEARANGSDVLAIPHNGNGSNGLMYERSKRSGEAMDRAYTEVRLRNEPVSEVIQIKGQSETHPQLSPNDEWAQFEILENILGMPEVKGEIQGSYARRALMDGLELEEQSGFNPYRFGMIGSSDGHNSSSPVEEDNFTGKIGLADGTTEARLLPARAEGLDIGDRSAGSPFSAAGLAGVWAESNTREDLFDAMRAREVFATSGPRIRLRLFAGADFSADDLGALAKNGYQRGVPMGGELTASDALANGLSFLAYAIQDPREAPLQRLQIIKSWVENGKAQEQVYDIACAGGVAPDANTHRCPLSIDAPNLDDCSYDAKEGQAELAVAWRDPDFDASQRAFYYSRVLQVPTCRWSSYEANREGLPRPPGAVHWLQERAVSSPIWYAPE